MSIIILYIIVPVLLFICSIYDLKKGEIENYWSYILGAVGIIYSIFVNQFKSNFCAALIIFIALYSVYIFSALIGKYGLGGADVRILTALALSIGYNILSIIIISSVLNIIYILFKSLFTRQKLNSICTKYVPFILVGYTITLFLINK
ncbi:peptidase A24 (plasmid) [Clostridium botulinum]|uniref:Type IV leader peptidase n=2 Tax=Clostridium botulinum TaxID=1491 RepID=A0A3F2ZVA1_CLOB6|nr:prepilin peptidase [Clostridium botulinum]ACQ51170.1 putative type IV leader peptidase [Clostridium botulinum Ba4 str. 657]AXG90409.1 peptidase A24 [Clostridium botulinum]MDI6919051.1 prepilin peptidase [Clostridium botulinum]NFM30495.1 peptidase A24 [Clostridium botulinum]RFM21133.1 peptidase A24 [Clostridium botulinum]